MISSAILILFASVSSGELLVNGDFQSGLDGWSQAVPQGIQFEAATEAGQHAAKIIIPNAAEPGYPQLFQRYPVTPGTILEGSVDAMARNVQKGHGVYAAIDFYNIEGARISYAQSDAAVPENEWVPLKIRATAPPETATARLDLLLNGTGEGLFRKASLQPIGDASQPPLKNPVVVTVTDRKVCDTFRGFGAEDDGWFYAPVNTEHGVDETDVRLREQRIEWMDPDWQRMFFWCKDWNPSGDWETFDFDTPNMLSHYRTLDLYQRIGAAVNVVGTEWGKPDAYKDVEKVARAVGALLEHLIRDKGYTCVQEWTLTNEPNGRLSQMGVTFDEFVRVHTLVKEEVVRRNLNVRIVGSDDTNGLPFFTACVANPAYFAAADVFASHRYLPFADRPMMSYFIDDRLDLLKAKTPVKPFYVAEFGFHDDKSGTLENPIMETYPYAVWTQAFVIDGLNRGVSAFSIWCMHEVYYGMGGFMNYGLWNYKNRDWQVRPVYHSWASFCRLTEPGESVYLCESTSPAHVIAARVGDTFFWVNRCDEKAEIKVEKASLGQVRVMTETNLAGDRECGDIVARADNAFSAPPQSFGYAEVK